MDYTGKERTGHWTQEEMEYLEAIVQEFRDGSLPLKDGATLRAYLAKQLHCGVKRVSKKMEGTEYNGRHSFVQMSFTEEEKRAREARLNVFKERFEQSVVRHERLKTARFDELQGPLEGAAAAGEEPQQQPGTSVEVRTTGTSASPSSNASLGLVSPQAAAASAGTGIPLARSSWPPGGWQDTHLNDLLRSRMAGVAPSMGMGLAPGRFVPTSNAGSLGMVNPTNTNFASLHSFGGGYSSNTASSNAELLSAMLAGNLGGPNSMANGMAAFRQHQTSYADDENLKRTILTLALQGRTSEPDTKRVRTNY